MELAKQIDGAPKNGDFIILQDACSRELGRWAQEANGWVQPDGTPVRISPTHWTPLSDDVDGLTDRERSLFLAAPLPEPTDRERLLFLAATLPDDETEQTQKRPLTRLILALVIAIFCIGGFAFWIGSEDSSSKNSAADLEQEFSRERARASVAIGGLTAARERENVGLTEALESKRIADSKKEFKQALDESEARSEALARELASARENDVAARNLAAARERENATQALETKQIADAKQNEFKQALDESEAKSEALARELASARENEVAARNLAATRERENAAQTLETKQIADAKQKELKQALDESEKRALALKGELTSARENDVAARNLAAARERENAAQALETKQIADAGQKELKQALEESEAKSEALARELASARENLASDRENEVAARNLAARERENAAQALETKRIADARQKELRQALDESEKRALALKGELTSARENDVAAHNLAATRERENAAQTLETKQIADAKKEVKQALDEREAKSEALARELASARENEVAAHNLAAARERENAAQALETKQIADARQKELRQALDESEKRA